MERQADAASVAAYLKALDRQCDNGELAQLRAAFIDAAGRYSQRHGISHKAWVEVGVDRATLRKAGITVRGRPKD